MPQADANLDVIPTAGWRVAYHCRALILGGWLALLLATLLTRLDVGAYPILTGVCGFDGGVLREFRRGTLDTGLGPYRSDFSTLVHTLALLGFLITQLLAALYLRRRMLGAHQPAWLVTAGLWVLPAPLISLALGLFAAMAEVAGVWPRMVLESSVAVQHYGYDLAERDPRPLLAAAAVAWIATAVVLRRYRHSLAWSVIAQVYVWLMAAGSLLLLTAIYQFGDLPYHWLPISSGWHTTWPLSLGAIIWLGGVLAAVIFRVPHRVAAAHPRATSDHCLACGYNLTGTVAAGRAACPECGEAVCDEQFQAVTKRLAL